jgi:hypothetical protein
LASPPPSEQGLSFLFCAATRRLEHISTLTLGVPEPIGYCAFGRLCALFGGIRFGHELFRSRLPPRNDSHYRTVEEMLQQPGEQQKICRLQRDRPPIDTHGQ